MASASINSNFDAETFRFMGEVVGCNRRAKEKDKTARRGAIWHGYPSSLLGVNVNKSSGHRTILASTAGS